MYDVLKATLCATWRAPCIAMTTIHQLDPKVFMAAVLEAKTKNQVKTNANSESTKRARQQDRT